MHIKFSWSFAALLGLTPLMGCSADAPEPPTSEPELSTVMLTGQIALPPVHITNLYHYRFPEIGQRECNTDDPFHAHESPGLPPIEAIRYDEVMELTATPLLPEEGVVAPEQVEYEIYHGTVAPDGSFTVEVPPSEYGYILAANGHKMRLKRRVPGRMVPKQQIDDVVIDIEHTLLTDTAYLLMEKGHGAMSDDAIRAKAAHGLETLAWQVGLELENSFRVEDWAHHADRLAKSVMQKEGVISNELLTHTAATNVIYNVVQPTDVTSLPGLTTINFGAYTGPITTQYLPQGLQVRKTPLASGNAVESGGILTTGVVAGQGLEFIFRNPAGAPINVRTMGLELQNGNTHTDTTSAFARRGFRFKLYSFAGALIHEYRWYTNQTATGGSFYGISVPSPLPPIYRMRIEMIGNGPFTIDNLHFSTYYNLSLSPTLGWRADGDWATNTRPTSTTFSNTSRGITASTGDCATSTCVYDENASGGTFWEINYGGTHGGSADGSKLMSPAFTLSNFPLDADDTNGLGTVLLPNNLINGTILGLTAIGAIPSGPRPFCSGSLFCTHYNERLLNSQYRLNSWTSVPVGGGTGISRAETMAIHWSHVHFQSYIDTNAVVAYGLVGADPTNTERAIEYSTDNGATWRRAWWYEDMSHRGPNGVWWNSHMHPMPDSDLEAAYGTGSGTPCANTDFDKDGVVDYDADINGDGVGALADAADCREWDTEFYMDVPSPMVTGAGSSLIEASTMMYRFRFNSTGGAAPLGCATPCTGWAIDDVALSGDYNPSVDSYYTTFDQTENGNL